MSIRSFPAELIKFIAIELSDKDLCNFSLACRTFHGAVHGDQVVWRSCFLEIYDEPAKKKRNGYDWKRTYQARQRLLLRELRNIEFEAGTSEKEQEALEVLQELLLDARGHLDPDLQGIKGTNFEHIRAANIPHSLFISRSQDHANPLLQAISLFLTPLSHLPETKHFPEIQSIIYNPNNEPTIIADGFPNIRTLEALAQFFTYHVHPRSESLVFHQKSLLQPHEFPSFWEGSLAEESSRIPTKWFGAYTYLNHPGMRTMHFLPDRSDGYLVDMTLSFTSSSSSSSEHRFTGTGRDFIAFSVQSGKLSPLPSPPGASTIPGWKKVQFIKDYRSHRWAYEGVMLPGNNMILGHWRHSLDEAYAVFSGQSGPFVFWAAPEASSLELRDNRVSVNRVGTV